jgi:dTDP-glucose 4,6-dehydratase
MTLVLVTGGCGFIGSNLIHYLLEVEPDIHILNFDALTYAGNLANLADVAQHPRYHFIRGDITERDQVWAAMRRGVTDIFHLAAESHVDRSILDATPFVRTNVLGTQVLLDAARAFSIRRFVHVSTDEVYGSLGPTGAFTEESPLQPNSPYAASKAAADLMVRAYHHTFGVPALITRCSNNYGPYQFPEKIIPLFITNLLRDEPVPVYGDGLQVRDWIHVRDHCRGLHLAWKHGQVGEIYNFGGRCELTNLELTRRILRLLGKPESLIRFVPDRPGHDRRYALDCTKAERTLGWSAQISFDEGLEQTIRWYCDHADWVAAIRTQDYMNYYQRQYGSLSPSSNQAGSLVSH